jgi:hypothetical protein
MATLDLEPLNKWKESITMREKHVALVQTHLVATNSIGEQFLDALKDQDWLGKLLQQFVKEEVLGVKGKLREEFKERESEGQKYFPHYLPKEDRSRSLPAGIRHPRGYSGKGKNRGRLSNSERSVPMDRGFQALWNTINRQTYSMEGNDRVVNVGDGQAMSALPLNAYMGTSGKGRVNNSPYNKLWMAVEYGTGVASNVGGSQYVNHEGPTKLDSPAGAWFFENKQQDNNGGLFTGQKGFHFLYDERTRKPKTLYEKYFRERFPAYIRAALGSGDAVKLR